MAKKQKKTRTKHKQKQKQSQNVIVHIDQSRRTAPRKPQEERPKSSSIPSFPVQFMTYAPTPITQPRVQPEPFAQAQAQTQAQPQVQVTHQSEPASEATASASPIDERFQGHSQKVGESIHAKGHTPFASPLERGLSSLMQEQRRESLLTSGHVPWNYDDVSEMGDTLDMGARAPRREGKMPQREQFAMALSNPHVSEEDARYFDKWNMQLRTGTRKSFKPNEMERIRKYLA